ncbi:MAG TPA: NosD domain-containing protein, partial [Bacteroidales bacterium]|nr:NosD domain-containing protein [Bacteroidales bacterium]
MARKLIILALLVHFIGLHAQSPITFAGKEIATTSTVSVPVRVDQFSQIGAISLTLTYDTNVLDFEGLSGQAFAGFLADSNDSRVRIGWMTDGYTPAPSLPAGSILCYLDFGLRNDGTSLLVWEDNGISCEYAGFPSILPLPDTPYTSFYINGWVSSLHATLASGPGTGELNAVVSGGTAPYTYAWSGPGGFSAGNQATILAGTAGTYTVTITDALGALNSTAYQYLLPVHNLDTHLDYATIQEAIDAAETLNGHRIAVDSGVYAENVWVYKSLQIQGSGAGGCALEPIDGIALRITADQVRIEGFEIAHNSMDGPEDIGLLLDEASGSVILHNLIANNHTGICIRSGADSATQNLIIDNIIRDNNTGILLQDDETGAGLPGSVAGNDIRDNAIHGNTAFGLNVLGTAAGVILSARPNYWGDASGPTHAFNPCGKGDAVSPQVETSPWWFHEAMNTYGGLPCPAITGPLDAATLARTPLILRWELQYPDLSGFDDTIKADLVLGTTLPAFPAGTTLLGVRTTIDGVITEHAPMTYDLSSSNQHLMSEVTTTPAIAASTLSGKQVEWTLTILAPNSPVSNMAVFLHPASYLHPLNCLSACEAADTVLLDFNSVQFDLHPVHTTVCAPSPVVFQASITYPNVVNIDTQITADALIRSTYYFPAGTIIHWSYGSGGASGNYSLPAYDATIYLSEITGGGAPFPLTGQNGLSETWTIEITNAGSPGLIELSVEPMVRMGQKGYVHDSADILLTLNNCRINGFFQYNNTVKTPLGGVDLGLYRDGSLVQSAVTASNGYYSFASLSPGNYEVRATSQKPVGSINATDAGMLNLWQVSVSPLHPIPMEKVNFLAGDVAYPLNILTSFDAFHILNHFVSGGTTPWPRPGSPRWCFWKTGDLLSQNQWADGTFPSLVIDSTTIGQ